MHSTKKITEFVLSCNDEIILDASDFPPEGEVFTTKQIDRLNALKKSIESFGAKVELYLYKDADLEDVKSDTSTIYLDVQGLVGRYGVSLPTIHRYLCEGLRDIAELIKGNVVYSADKADAWMMEHHPHNVDGSNWNSLSKTLKKLGLRQPIGYKLLSEGIPHKTNGSMTFLHLPTVQKWLSEKHPDVMKVNVK